MKNSADTKRKNHNIAIEDHVFLKTKNMNFKRNTKLFHVRVESFKIIEQKEKVVFILKLLKRKSIYSTFHVALLDKAHPKISLQKNWSVKSKNRKEYEMKRILDKKSEYYLIK